MISTLYRDPFALGSPHISEAREGCNLVEIVRINPFLPKDFLTRGDIAINGEIIPREYWSRIKPKRGAVVSMHAQISGGGGEGGGGKAIFGLIAAIALTIITAGIAAGVLAPVLGASFAAGTLGASILSGVVGLVGSLALSALSSPPTTKPGAEQAASGVRLEAASVSGNLLEGNTPVARVIGTRRVFPAFVTEPIIERIGQDEIVEALWGLAGAHALSDIRLGDAAIDLNADTAKDIEIEVRNGLPGDVPVTLAVRQGRTTEPNLELSVHTVDPENQDTLQGSDPLPVFHTITTRIAPEENWIHLNLIGLARQNDTGSLRIPFRMRMRKKGNTAWRDFPEFHYQNDTQNQVNLQIKIFWGETFTDVIPNVPPVIGFVEARKNVPGQDVQPLGVVFNSDIYFSNGSGNDVLRTGTETTTNLKNTILYAEHIDFYLDATQWPAGIYDIEIKRGEVFENIDFNSTTYEWNSDILDFFGRIDSGVIPVSREGLLDTVSLVRMVNVWNQYPVIQQGMTLVAVQARNRAVQKLSALASGYVKDLPRGRGPRMHKGTITNGNDAFTRILLHFDGADASTTFTDSNVGGAAKVWGAAGNAQIDTAQSKFGGASGLFDGTGDWVQTADSAEFALGTSDWTVDCWINCVGLTGAGGNICGQGDAGAAAATTSFFLTRSAVTNALQLRVSNGTTVGTLTGTTAFTNLLNPGWHHVAAVRTGNILKLFVDGIQEGGDSTFTGTVPNAATTFTVGARSDAGGTTWNGWIDEFRLSVGVARWTANFTPPVGAYATNVSQRGFMSFDAAGASSANVEILALIRVPPQEGTTSFEAPRIALRGAGVAGAESWYQFGLRYVTANLGSMDAIAIDKLVAGAGTNLTLVPFPWAFDRNFFLRFRANGSTLQGKAWPASLSEPDDWMTTVTDTSISAAGLVGVSWSASVNLYDANFNWFSVGLNGDTAPSPPDLHTPLATDFSTQTIGNNLLGWTAQIGTLTSVVSENASFPYNGKQENWNAYRTTSNPAAHFRDILTGGLNFDPLPEELLDDDSLVAWWRRCAAADFTCNMVVEGLEVPDLLRVVASCGYGRLYRSELFGVIQDFDRSADAPVQIFSPRNSSGLSWRKAFARLPAGFRINFRSEDLDYGSDQVIVYRSSVEGSSDKLEQVTYDGLVTESDIIRRATFDLLQAERRSAFYSLNTPAESIVCRRGDLIGVTHDILQTHYGYARIRDVIYDDFEITGIILDAPIEVVTTDDVISTFDMLAVGDVLELGIQTGIAIRLTDGSSSTHAISTPTGHTDELTFVTPVVIKHGYTSSFDRNLIHTIAPGCLVVAGVLGSEYKRLVVSEIAPQTNLEAQLVCVDEASDIFTSVFGVSL